MDLMQLWFPVLLSAIVVFCASFLAWVVLPHHKKDVKALPDEPAVTAHLEGLSLPPNAIFFGKPVRFVLTDFFDGVLYGLLTAGVFAWLWPAAG